MRARGGRVATVLMAALVVATWAPSPVGGQVAPTLAVEPAGEPVPGDTVRFVLTGCTTVAEPPTIFIATQDSDAVVPMSMEPVGVGEWELEQVVAESDLEVLGAHGCAEGPPEPASVVVDVDAPHLHFGFTGSAIVVFLTDCPPERSAPAPGPTIHIDAAGPVGPFDVHGPDTEGDYWFDLTEALPPGQVTVTAVCGDRGYGPLTLSGPGDTTTTTSSTVATAPVPPPAHAPPATPVAAAARLTG